MEKRTSNKSSLAQIAALLNDAGSVLIFPHLQMDGDTLGSSVALCSALRKQGKIAYVLIEDEIPGILRFLDNGYCTAEYSGMEADVCIALDCSDWMRLEKGKKRSIMENRLSYWTIMPHLNLPLRNIGM